MVNKDWTWEEAQAATEEALKIDPARSNDPTLPIFQWVALHDLDAYEKLYDKDKYYLMTAIRVCSNHDLPLPEWASRAYIKAYDTVNCAHAKSWDTVFGNPYPKGAHLNAIRKKRSLSYSVHSEIRNRMLMNPDLKIDDGLFEEVGKKFNIGRTLASEYYYHVKEIFMKILGNDGDKLIIKCKKNK